VFVHGLRRANSKVWMSSGTKPELWPCWLADDIEKLGIWSVEHDSAPTRWRGHAMPLSYLQHLRLLSKLQPAGFAAIIPASEVAQGNNFVRYENLATRATSVIESIRRCLSDGIASGKVILAPAVRGTDERHGRIQHHPTFEVMEAVDLKNFHAGSHDRRIVPIVVATMAGESPFELRWGSDGVAGPIGSNGNNLGKFVAEVVKQTPGQAGLDGEQWSRTGYKPTPTIIEAAQALYQGHRVENITRSDAGAKNLSETAACLAEIIEDAKAHQRKSICFVTGVPGAGKTLAGLNLVRLGDFRHLA